MLRGIVTKSTGKWYRVRAEDQKTYLCRIKGKFRLDGHKLTNPVAVGDAVLFEPESYEDRGMIQKIETRRNYVMRQSPRRKHYMHLIACNIDQAFLIVTIAHPTLKIGFIDRFLLTTESRDIPTFLIFNKADLYNEEEYAMFQGMKAIYEKLGYQCLLVSAQEGTGLDEVRTLLKNKTTLISGHSGVGKSTLANALEPELELRTQEISNYSGKGTHTTTFAEMHTLEMGGYLIDTPGIKELGFINMQPLDIAHNFTEIFAYSSQCKFNNCLHVNEPHCAVKDAIEREEISILRYQNYLHILEEVQAQNAWEQHKNW